MKNKILKITSVVLAMVLALSMLVYAEGEDTITMTEESASLVISSAESFEIGEKISMQVKLNSSAPLNSIAVVDMKYDSSVLKFTGFAEHDGIDAMATFKTWNDEYQEFILGLAEAVKFDESNADICTIEFEAVGSGVTKLEVQAVVKNNSDEFNVAIQTNEVVVIDTFETVFNPDDDSAENRKEDAIFMCIGENTAIVYGNKTYIDSENKQVVPYIKNDRTLVPLRFVSESIGAEVLWEEGWDYCIINKDDKEIKITFGSAEFEVNGETFTYEAPIETVHDRTMVPVRFISEHLGYDVYWQEANQAVVVTPIDNPWVENKAAESTAFMEALVTIKGILP